MADQPGWRDKPAATLNVDHNRSKVNLKTAKFDELVLNQGVRVKVFRSTYCPRIKSIDGAEHELNCPLCRGDGFIDKYCKETWAFIQTQELEKGIFVEGLYDGNRVAATFMQGIELQYFTLVELLDFTEAYYERMKRQNGQIDVLKYGAVAVNLIVDYSGKEYYEGSDFKLNGDGNIQWCNTGRRPAKGVIYSVHYDTQIRFRAIRAMHSNRFAQVTEGGQVKLVKMNEQWMLQKVYLVENSDAKGKPIMPNKIRDEDVPDDLDEIE